MIIIKGDEVITKPTGNEVWITQLELAGFFECFIAKVGFNIRTTFKTRVLDEQQVCRTYDYQNGNSVEQYNLKMVIPLLFGIKTKNADVFRNWATWNFFPN